MGQIADSAYRFEREVNDGTRIIVGVNAFTEGDDADQDGANLLRIEQDTEDFQLKRLAAVKQARDDGAVNRSLELVRNEAEDPGANLVPPIIEAVNATPPRARSATRSPRCSAGTSSRPSSSGLC